MPPTRLIRAPIARIYDHGAELTLLGADGVTRRLSDASAELGRAVLDFLTEPREPAEVRAHIAELSGQPVAPGGVVDELLALLRAAGVVVAAPESYARPRGGGEARRRVRLVLGLTGAVATVHAPVLVSLLQQRGFEVRVATTANALRFVSAAGLEALTHATVYSGLWQRDAQCPVPHINLAEWAEVVLVCPATATTLARIAAGSCNDLVSAVALATRAPTVLVPSMNTAMYTAPAVRRNLATLRDDGFYLVHPAVGLEVAHRPTARTPVYGPAPPFETVVEILESIVAERLGRGGAGPVAPQDARGWDRLYAEHAPAELPWTTDALDPDVAAALAQLAPPPRRLLDLGAGAGAAAVDAARRGYTVVATDVSPTALAQARRRDGALPVAFVVDDVLASRLTETFDVVHDRGCLHLLPPERRGAYAAAVARLTAPGGLLLVKSHDPAEGATRGTHPLSRADVAELLGHDFELLSAEPSTLPGPAAPPPRAVLYVLRRRAPAPVASP